MCRKNEIRLYFVCLSVCLSPYTQTNSKWTKGLNLEPELLELLEENLGMILLDIGLSE